MMDDTQLALLLGVLALASWMVAGLVAVLVTHEEIRHTEAARRTDFLTLGLTVAGVLSAIGMAAVLVVA